MVTKYTDLGIAQADDPIYQQGWIMGGWITKGVTLPKNQTKSNEDNQDNKIIITKQSHKNLLAKYAKLRLSRMSL